MLVAKIPNRGNEPLEIVFSANGTEVRTLNFKTNSSWIALILPGGLPCVSFPCPGVRQEMGLHPERHYRSCRPAG